MFTAQRWEPWTRGGLCGVCRVPVAPCIIEGGNTTDRWHLCSPPFPDPGNEDTRCMEHNLSRIEDGVGCQGPGLANFVCAAGSSCLLVALGRSDCIQVKGLQEESLAYK
jgi:hypothetical protein